MTQIAAYEIFFVRLICAVSISVSKYVYLSTRVALLINRNYPLFTNKRILNTDHVVLK